MLGMVARVSEASATLLSAYWVKTFRGISTRGHNDSSQINTVYKKIHLKYPYDGKFYSFTASQKLKKIITSLYALFIIECNLNPSPEFKYT